MINRCKDRKKILFYVLFFDFFQILSKSTDRPMVKDVPIVSGEQ